MKTRLSIAVALTTLAAATAAAASPEVPRFVGCSGFAKQPAGSTGVVRPHSIVVACGDGNFWIGSLHWKTWSATGATAVGSAHQNDCVPYCAAGHFHAYPASVTLSGAHQCAGKVELTRISWRFTKAKPARVPRTGSETFRCA